MAAADALEVVVVSVVLAGQTPLQVRMRGTAVCWGAWLQLRLLRVMQGPRLCWQAEWIWGGGEQALPQYCPAERCHGLLLQLWGAVMCSL